jgi:hypothetical protein
MTPQEKENIHIRLRDALEEEKISQRIAQDHLGINQGYVSMIKLGNNLKAVPDKIWDKIMPWYDSQRPITTFMDGVFVHRGSVVETKSVEEFIDNAQKDLDQAQKDLDSGVEHTNMTDEIVPSKERFYNKVYMERFYQLHNGLSHSLQLNDALRPDWVEEYNELYGKIYCK